MLAGQTDIGTVEAFYTTQTLKVYVHDERDQVEGFTGNILDGDKRHSGLVSDKLEVQVRYIATNGRSRPFTPDLWNASKNTKDDKKGALTFSHLPAALDIVVVADEARGANVKVLSPDEIAAYEDFVENGVMGGAFGDMGGVSQTVSLCPLTDPDGQDPDECGSFAYVNTYAVDGQAWKNQVERDDGEDFETETEVAVPGTTVEMDPVTRKEPRRGERFLRGCNAGTPAARRTSTRPSSSTSGRWRRANTRSPFQTAGRRVAGKCSTSTTTSTST